MNKNNKLITFGVIVILIILLSTLCFWGINSASDVYMDNFNPVRFKEGELDDYLNYVYDTTQNEYDTYIKMSEYFIANEYISISDYDSINYYIDKLQTYYDATTIFDFYFNDKFQGWLFIHYIKIANSYSTQGEREEALIGVCYLCDENLYNNWCSDNSICNFNKLIPITENIYVFCIVDYDVYNNKFYSI